MLDISRHGRVCVLTLDRPDYGNRITQHLCEALTAVLDDARTDPSVGGCVLTGRGDVFCLGGDYLGAGQSTAGRLEFGQAHIAMVEAMARLGKPLVAAINGSAHAGGFSLVVSCDMAFVAEDATLGMPEAAHGLFPFLALAIGKDALPKKLLFDLVYNARLLTAAEACALHLSMSFSRASRCWIGRLRKWKRRPLIIRIFFGWAAICTTACAAPPRPRRWLNRGSPLASLSPHGTSKFSVRRRSATLQQRAERNGPDSVNDARPPLGDDYRTRAHGLARDFWPESAGPG